MEVQQYSTSNMAMIKMRNGIILDLYVALPRMNVQCNLHRNLHIPVNLQHMILIMSSNLEIE